MGENIFALEALFKYENIAFDFSYNNHLIYGSLYCERCSEEMSIVTDKSKKYGIKWICYKCGTTKSILYGSIFYGAKLQMSKVYHLLYYWLHGARCYDASSEVDVHINTVTYYFTLFRNACDSYCVSSNIPQIGGTGKTVQIDETLICHRKYNVGRILNDVWIFGGVCVEDKQFFCCAVPNRTKETLKEEIENYILPGTIIVSDCWKAYDFLDDSDDYTHLTVNHSKNFINPENFANTQTIERMWVELKQINKRYRGIPRDKINEHISEFMWRYNVLNKTNNKFQAAIALLADTQFLKVMDE